MGADLTLIPVAQVSPDGLTNALGAVLGDTRISLIRDLDLFDAWDKLIPKFRFELPLFHFEDEGLKETNIDACGTPLFFAYASDMVDASRVFKLCKWNKAAIAFLAALPPAAKIILYWR
jgi:hypothetical protein